VLVEGGAVVLRASPGLEGPIAIQGIALVGEEIDHCEVGCVIREGDGEAAASAG